MENLKKLLAFLAPLPVWLRVILAALVTAIVSICLLMTACTMVSSCGITQSVVNNVCSDGNTIEMGVTPSTTTSTTAEVPINTPLQNFMWSFFVLLNCVRINGDKSEKQQVMRRIVVEADDEDAARKLVSNFLYAHFFSSSFRIESYDIQNVISMPPLFYVD